VNDGGRTMLLQPALTCRRMRGTHSRA
jgi:hypothetical protein